MGVKETKLIVRIPPGLKKRIEYTAKRQNKNVSDFVRDIISIFVDKDNPQYLEAVNGLYDLLTKQKELQDKIYESNNPHETDLLMEDLTYLNQMIFESERKIKEFLDSKL